MIIDRIVFTETFPTGPYANQKLQVEGTLEPGESVEEAFKQAKEKTELSFKGMNPNVGEVHTYLSHSAQLQEVSDPNIDAEINAKYYALVEKITAAEYKEDALLLLNSSDFKFNLDLKRLISSKPSLEITKRK